MPKVIRAKFQNGMVYFIMSPLEIEYIKKKKTTLNQNRNSSSGNIHIMNAPWFSVEPSNFLSLVQKNESTSKKGNMHWRPNIGQVF